MVTIFGPPTDRVDLTLQCHATTMVKRPDKASGNRTVVLEKYYQSSQAEKEKKCRKFFHPRSHFKITRGPFVSDNVSLSRRAVKLRGPLRPFPGWRGKARGQDPQRRPSGPSSFCCCRPPPTQGALGQGQRGIRWTMRSVVGGRNTGTRKRRTTKKKGGGGLEGVHEQIRTHTHTDSATNQQ